MLNFHFLPLNNPPKTIDATGMCTQRQHLVYSYRSLTFFGANRTDADFLNSKIQVLNIMQRNKVLKCNVNKETVR